MRQFCTAFDSGGLLKGLALYHSLTRHLPGATLRVLCLDAATERVLGGLPLPGLRPLPLAELEAAEPRLRAVRPDRTGLEYAFTCVPALLWHLLTRSRDAAPVTHLDADVYFLADPAPVLEEATAGSITVTPNRSPSAPPDPGGRGRYNAGWLTVMDDAEGRTCVAGWRNRCVEWCFDRVEGGRFAHLGYLDEWPERFASVHVLAHEGAGVAPWNVLERHVTAGPRGPRAGGSPLVFYTFRGFERILPWLFDPGLAPHGAGLTPALRDMVYLPYLAELRRIEDELRRSMPFLPRPWRSTRSPDVPGLLREAARRRLLVARHQ